MKNVFAALCLLFGTVSCAGMVVESAQSATAGIIGCPAREVVITDVHSALGATSWTASCRGTRMVCSKESDGKYQTSETHCTPEQTPGT